jgi:hypothetical protein
VVEIEVQRRRPLSKVAPVAGLGGNPLQGLVRRNLRDVGCDVGFRQVGIDRDHLIVVVELDADERAENRNTVDLLAEFNDGGPGQRHGLDAQALEFTLVVIDLRRGQRRHRGAGKGVREDALGGAFGVEIFRVACAERECGGGRTIRLQRRERAAAVFLRDVHRDGLKAARGDATRRRLPCAGLFRPFCHDCVPSMVATIELGQSILIGNRKN